MKKEKLTIIKVGGKIVEDGSALQRLLSNFSTIDGRKLLVHGGGRSATALAARLGIETKMVDGRRITDDSMLEVVTMVYGGLVNKRIVAGLQAAGVNAVGLTGADMNAVLSVRRSVGVVDYGWVGDVRIVNADAISTLVENGYCPVIAPITHDGKGHLLNTNADTMAGETAKALASRYDVDLVYCFEKAGVLFDENDDSSVIDEINPCKYNELKESGKITGGMIPKLDNAFSCVAAGVSRVVITRADLIADANAGTKIVG